jgi:20S proteasome alpha/beta subunit
VAVVRYAAIGCGGPIAWGVLEAARTPDTLEDAATLALLAVKIACKRNVFCGGAARVVIAPRRGRPVVR